DAPLSAALRTDNRACAGLGAGAVALLAGVLLLELDCLLGAAGDLGERQLDLCFQIEPALHASRLCAAPPPPTTGPERAAEDVLEHRKDVRRVHVREVVLVHPSHPLVAEL